MTELIPPYGGELVDPMLPEAEAAQALEEALHLPSIFLTRRQLCDAELLLNGGFSPLTGFMTRAEYEGVRDDLRLPDGTVWPMPITLDVDDETAETFDEGDRVTVRDPEGFPLAILTVSDIWQPDLRAEARAVFGTEDTAHPAVAHLLDHAESTYVGGTLEGLDLPNHPDFPLLRHTPAELRHAFEKQGWTRVVAFQTRNPMHRVHLELTVRAAEDADANLLIHPVVGMTKPGDVHYYTRVRCYNKLIDHYPAGTAMLSLLPLAMRMGGPREALWHAIIRRNHGCSHFVVGRDHAGPGAGSDGEDFYGPYEAQELIREHAEAVEVEMVSFQELAYVANRDEYLPADEVTDSDEVLRLSGTELRRRLDRGLEIPEWFSYPEVIEELRNANPPRHEQGVTVFFTGLPAAGKSTLAKALMTKLYELGRTRITLLDGDIVRTHLSSELGFSKEHRSINVRRIGFVASEITKNGGVAICAPIAPYEADRRANRQLIGSHGGYCEVHVSTPLGVCEQRDPKGLYAKARKGMISDFTGIDDPYEEPQDPELRIDTSEYTVDQAVQEVLHHLEREGYIA